jgi:hypothetical protein
VDEILKDPAKFDYSVEPVKNFVDGQLPDRFIYNDGSGDLIIEGVITREERDLWVKQCPNYTSAIEHLYQKSQLTPCEDTIM